MFVPTRQEFRKGKQDYLHRRRVIIIIYFYFLLFIYLFIYFVFAQVCDRHILLVLKYRVLVDTRRKKRSKGK
jgi:hypothetical protein